MECCIREVVPWSCKKEFELVYQNAYAKELHKKRWAVNQIGVWKTWRGIPCLPTCVEVTEVIVRAIIQDILSMHNATLCQPPDIALMYGQALIRFVNLVCELDYTSKYCVPAYQIAQKNGVPAWIVSLRHDASHNTYPSIIMLRNGAETCLSWLQTHFWEIELASFIDNVILPPYNPDLAIVASITKFHDAQIQHFNKYAEISEVEDDKISFQILNDMKVLLKNHKEKFFEVIVKPGIFLQDYETLTKLLNKSELPFLEDDSIELPESLVRFWAPFFHLAQNLHLVQDFVIVLLMNQKEYGFFYEKLTVSWILKILRSALFDGMVKNQQSLFQSHRIDFYWKGLLTACLASPTVYTSTLIPIILSNLNVDERHLGLLMKLAAIKLGALNGENNQKQNLYHLEKRLLTVKKLKKAQVTDLAYREGRKTIEPDVWQLVDRHTKDFSLCPLGVVLGEKTYNEAESEEAFQEKVVTVQESPKLFIENEAERFIINNEEDNINIEDHSHQKFRIMGPINFLQY